MPVPGAAILSPGELTFMVAQGCSVVAQNSRRNEFLSHEVSDGAVVDHRRRPIWDGQERGRRHGDALAGLRTPPFRRSG
jgi:hypothetical protein